MTSINPNYNINYVQMPKLRAKETNSVPVTNPVPQPNVCFKGTEALAAYNYNLINKNNDFDDLKTIKAIEIPNDMTKIGGTPVYNSKGELVLVEKTIGDKKYVYHNNDDKKIEVFDKKGNKISEQICFQNAGDGKTIMVDEFIPGKKDYYSTSYISSDGKTFELFDNMKHVSYPDGTEKDFIYEAKEGKNRIIERDGKSFNDFYSRAIDYDKNNNVEYVSEHADNYSTYKEIKYIDGVPYSVNEDKQTTIKNNVLEKLGVLSDNDLKPHKKINFLSEAKNIEGEKTYYSNGNVETNTFMQEGKKYKYTYLANGDLINVESDNIFVEYTTVLIYNKRSMINKE